MRVQVRLYAALERLLPDTILEGAPQPVRAGTPLAVELAEGSTLADLLAWLELPPDRVKVIFVDGRIQPLDYCLRAGEQVGLFPPIGGG